MKKFTLLTLLLGVLVVGTWTSSIAQTKPTSQHSHEKCGSMHWLEDMFRIYPEYKAMYEKNEKALGEAITKKLEAEKSNPAARTNSIITIPIVFHIVSSNPSAITDAMIQAQLDTLNKDFGGLNGDSVKIPAAFKPLYGKGQMRFCFAQRTPTNMATNGIVRYTSSTTSQGAVVGDRIKYSAMGGADAWDPSKYVNIWVCNFANTSLLGYATFPPGAPGVGTGFPTQEQGAVILIGTLPGGTASPYNRGRTLTHELGHFFWLRHIWGDANCGDDFPNTPGIDDTPQQNNDTGGCPTGVVASGCASSPNPPGRMYQNFMDYTDDACMVMFTKGQNTRSEQALTLYRSSLTTSNGCVPPVAVTLDASIQSVVEPANNSQYCNTNIVAPRVILRNAGTTTLTSATIFTRLNGGAPVPFSWTGSLVQNATIQVTLPSITLVSGTNNVVFYSSLPNGGTDLNNANDTARVTTSYVVGSGAPLPLVEGFEGTTFPPAGWSVINPDAGSITWARSTLAAKSGSASARINIYNYGPGLNGHMDYLRSPLIDFNNAFDSAFINFHYAYKLYSTADLGDTLDVMVSTDCGNTWTSLWKRGGTTLVTTPGVATNNWAPTAAEWTTTPISVSLTAYKNVPIYLQFRTRNGYGQNIFLDDINIFGKSTVDRDAQVTAINSPVAEFCGSTVTPQVVVKNAGFFPLTSVKINSRVDNGPLATQTFTGINIAPNASQTFNLNAVTGLTNGAHVFTAYTSEPNGLADQFPSNDTLRKNFISNVAQPLPIVEGFEGATFPPAGWSIINPDAGITWARTTLAAKTGAASARVNHYNYGPAGVGQLDYLRAPLVNFNNAFDSALMTFQYAYKQYSAVDSDTLEVVVSTDCGATWTSLWKRGGSELTTSPGFTTASFVPTAAQWTATAVKLNLSAYLNSGNIFVAFRSKNGFGNNVYVDDINIFGKNAPNYDAVMAGITTPGVDQCEQSFTPNVFIANSGKITITSLKVTYVIDNGTPVVTNLTGLNIPTGGSTSVNLTPVNNLSIGAHTFRVYCSEPNGQADQNTANDTLNRNVSVKMSVNAPLVEGFEGTTFPPTGWEITQTPVDNITWARTTLAGRKSNASAFMNNYNYAQLGRVDNLISPVVRYSGADSIFLKFDVAAATYSFPGSTAIPLDTLEVLVTRDCGVTYTTVYKKFGHELQTVNAPNQPFENEFIPKADWHWRKDSVNLTALLGSTNGFRFRFKNTENYENNIFVDNVNIETKVVPAKLKNNGYMITPNPFRTNFVIQHYRAPFDLTGVGVYNSVGQRIMFNSYKAGTADSYINVNMSGFAAGVYTVKLVYTNRTVTQKIVKVN